MPIRHPSGKRSVVTRFETGIYIYTSQIQHDTRYIRAILMRVASGLFSWSMVARALGIFKPEFSLTIKHGPLSASHYVSFRSEAPCKYITGVLGRGRATRQRGAATAGMCCAFLVSSYISYCPPLSKSLDLFSPSTFLWLSHWPRHSLLLLHRYLLVLQ